MGVQVTCGRGRSLLSGRTQTGNDRLLVSQLPLVDSIFPPYFCIPLLPEDQLTSVPLLQSVPSVSSPLRHQRVLLAADQFPFILLQQVGGMRSLRRARVPPQVAVLQKKAGRREMSYFCIYCERGLPAQLSAGADRNRSAGDVLSRSTEIAAELFLFLTRGALLFLKLRSALLAPVERPSLVLRLSHRKCQQGAI